SNESQAVEILAELLSHEGAHVENYDNDKFQVHNGQYDGNNLFLSESSAFKKQAAAITGAKGHFGFNSQSLLKFGAGFSAIGQKAAFDELRSFIGAAEFDILRYAELKELNKDEFYIDIYSASNPQKRGRVIFDKKGNAKFADNAGEKKLTISPQSASALRENFANIIKHSIESSKTDNAQKGEDYYLAIIKKLKNKGFFVSSADSQLLLYLKNTDLDIETLKSYSYDLEQILSSPAIKDDDIVAIAQEGAGFFRRVDEFRNEFKSMTLSKAAVFLINNDLDIETLKNYSEILKKAFSYISLHGGETTFINFSRKNIDENYLKILNDIYDDSKQIDVRLKEKLEEIFLSGIVQKDENYIEKVKKLYEKGIPVSESMLAYLDNTKLNIDELIEYSDILKGIFRFSTISVSDLADIAKKGKNYLEKVKKLNENGIRISKSMLAYLDNTKLDIEELINSEYLDTLKGIFSFSSRSSIYGKHYIAERDKNYLEKVKRLTEKGIPISQNMLEYLDKTELDIDELINSEYLDMLKWIFSLHLSYDHIADIAKKGKNYLEKVKKLNEKGIPFSENMLEYLKNTKLDIDELINSEYLDTLKEIFSLYLCPDNIANPSNIANSEGIANIVRQGEKPFFETMKEFHEIGFINSKGMIEYIINYNDIEILRKKIENLKKEENKQNKELFVNLVDRYNIFLAPKDVISNALSGKTSFKEIVVDPKKYQEHNINFLSMDNIFNLKNDLSEIKNLISSEAMKRYDLLKYFRQRTNYELEEILKDNKKIASFFDELVYALKDIKDELKQKQQTREMKKVMPQLEAMLSKYYYVKGEGIEFKLSLRNVDNYLIGERTGDCTKNNEINEINFKQKWLMHEDYEILEVFIDGQFVARFDYIVGREENGSPAIFIHAQEDIPDFRSNRSSVVHQRELAYYQALEFIQNFARRNRYDSVYVNSLSNSSYISDMSKKVSDEGAFKPQLPNIYLQNKGWRLLNREKVADNIKTEKELLENKTERVFKLKHINSLLKNGLFKYVYTLNENEYIVPISDKFAVKYKITDKKQYEFDLVSSESVNFADAKKELFEALPKSQKDAFNDSKHANDFKYDILDEINFLDISLSKGKSNGLKEIVNFTKWEKVYKSDDSYIVVIGLDKDNNIVVAEYSKKEKSAIKLTKPIEFLSGVSSLSLSDEINDNDKKNRFKSVLLGDNRQGLPKDKKEVRDKVGRGEFKLQQSNENNQEYIITIGEVIIKLSVEETLENESAYSGKVKMIDKKDIKNPALENMEEQKELIDDLSKAKIEVLDPKDITIFLTSNSTIDEFIINDPNVEFREWTTDKERL
ncbi:MAG: hypothetical protein LBL00_08830, partial [Endomicrobium sp.]|nr:hypothetical protein [Endomicrobium sp.]